MGWRCDDTKLQNTFCSKCCKFCGCEKPKPVITELMQLAEQPEGLSTNIVSLLCQLTICQLEGDEDSEITVTIATTYRRQNAGQASSECLRVQQSTLSLFTGMAKVPTKKNANISRFVCFSATFSSRTTLQCIHYGNIRKVHKESLITQ